MTAKREAPKTPKMLQAKIDGQEARIYALEQSNVALIEETRKARIDATALQNLAERRGKDIELLKGEIGNLRDDLHRMEVDKSRLEGYIDHIHESEPQPAPVMVTVPETMVQPQIVNRRRDHDLFGLTNYGSPKDGPQPYYKRDI